MPEGIDRDKLRKLLEKGAQLVDVLPSPEFEEEHLPGAIHMPLRQVESGAIKMLDRNRPVIVYCWDSA